MIIKTRALDATDNEPDRIRARSGSGKSAEHYTEPFSLRDSLDVPDAHERTARRLAGVILGDREFTITRTGESATGYTFRVDEN
jgi:hypothetical protein